LVKFTIILFLYENIKSIFLRVKLSCKTKTRPFGPGLFSKNQEHLLARAKPPTAGEDKNTLTPKETSPLHPNPTQLTHFRWPNHFPYRIKPKASFITPSKTNQSGTLPRGVPKLRPRILSSGRLPGAHAPHLAKNGQV
jgi:hypothetical protein